jgi:hypothetical protein
VLARREPRRNDLGAPRQVDEAHVARALDPLAIAALQRRAREDHVARLRCHLAQPVDDAVEPRPAIVVGERDAGAHLLDVGGRMQVVRVDQRPAEGGRERRADRRLARSRHAHQHDDHGCCFAIACPPNALRIIASMRFA